MKKIGIMTDSHSGILSEEAQRLGIKVLPMPFYIGEKVYREGVDLSRDEFYDMLRKGVDVSTSQPSPTEVMDMWKEMLKEYEEIVYIPLSSALSGSCMTAEAMANEDEFAGKVFSEAGYGLTARGIEFLEEMENLGMIIDVAHLNDAGIRDVLKFTKKPFVASHSNARHLCSHPRNLNDELLKAIGERGGVIGLNYYAYFLRDWKDGETVVSRAEDIVAHAKYIRDMAGIEALGLGSDFDGMNGELEIASPVDMTKLEDVFKKNGFTESEIEKIFCKNVMRIYRELLG